MDGWMDGWWVGEWMDGWIHNNGTNVLENGDEKVF